MTSAAACLLILVAAACERTVPVLGAGAGVMNASPAPLLPETVVSLPSFDFDRYERLLYQLRGKPVIVNIWASWCKPCHKEAPALAAAARRYGHAIQFLGVDIQDQRGPAAAFAEELKLPYPSVFDGTGDIHDALGFVGLPDTVFYDADGTIAATWSGPLTTTTLHDKLAQLLAS